MFCHGYFTTGIQRAALGSEPLGLGMGCKVSFPSLPSQAQECARASAENECPFASPLPDEVCCTRPSTVTTYGQKSSSLKLNKAINLCTIHKALLACKPHTKRLAGSSPSNSRKTGAAADSAGRPEHQLGSFALISFHSPSAAHRHVKRPNPEPNRWPAPLSTASSDRQPLCLSQHLILEPEMLGAEPEPSACKTLAGQSAGTLPVRRKLLCAESEQGSGSTSLITTGKPKQTPDQSLWRVLRKGRSARERSKGTVLENKASSKHERIGRCGNRR